MEYINTVPLRGRVGYLRRRTVGDKEVASFSVAVEETFRKRTGEMATVTTWIDCDAWSGQNVDTAALESGCEVEAFGRISNRKYTDSDGQERKVTEVKVFELRILAYPAEAPAQAYVPPRQAAAAPAPVGTYTPATAAAEDDPDLPF